MPSSEHWGSKVPSDDPRRVVVIDPATDSVTTIIGKASAAPAVGELRERIGFAIADAISASLVPGETLEGTGTRVVDAVLRVLLGEAQS